MKSMTGYGRVQQVVSGYEITVEMRSVNHRYFEFFPRLPRAYGALEDSLKQLVHEKIARGKVDVFLSVNATESSGTQVELDEALAASYVEELRTFGKHSGLVDDLSLSHLTHFSDIFKLHREEVDQVMIWQAVQPVAEEALAQLLEMRTAEGQSTKEDILERLEEVSSCLNEIETLAPQTVKEYQARLYEKLTEVLEDTAVDEQRLLTEAAIFADRVAVDEETVRLRSHLEQMHTILEEEQPIGRKLDFLLQEINREVNTIGSKSQNMEVGRLVVHLKSTTEKIREQVQNIE